ncbi:mucoidy inhibitor MuiA family protein [Gemmata sp.]|uniref:mucoidy inhibitor MuiA family protein n=1 Tax=Gemmata sp. TaxID=1914242 RepID=UPI003F728427
MRFRLSLLSLAVLMTAAARADDKAEAVRPAASKITAVTVYANTALVTREVTAPDAAGLAEVVVSPMPPYTMQSSLYAEGTDNIRVLSVRFRTRAIAEDTREEVRKIDVQIKTLTAKQQALEAELKTVGENLKLLDKMEGFTAKSLEHLTDKGLLDTEKIIALAKFVQEDRTKRSKEQLAVKQQLEEVQAQLAFAKRPHDEKSGGVVRNERDAVILVDKKQGGGTVRLNYLVSSAAWRPQYKFRTGGKEKDQVVVEYQAAIEQKTGEDWTNAQITLSTAQPLLNASPPDLKALAVGVTAGASVAVLPGDARAPAPVPPGLAAGDKLSARAFQDSLEKESKNLRGQVAGNYAQKKGEAAEKLQNDAAALEQFCDLFVSSDEFIKADFRPVPGGNDGPSVTYVLKPRLTIPSRNDEQVVEITKLDFAPKFYYKAVPVLTANVYRLADMVNTSDVVLLPGEATMYLGGDFVGSAKVPLVAVGKPFTVGFGVDPQLQVSRVLVDRTRTTQGGNQVLTFKYRVLLTSYKSAAVPVQVWDRMPHAEAAMTIAVNLRDPKPDLSTDPLYVRDEKAKGLLRWDVTVDPKQHGEKALAIDYEFKMELDKNVNIGSFQAK